jgi:hypothetical protein
MYNYETRRFLQEIASCHLMPELLAEIGTLPNLKFYDGSIVVQVQDHQYAMMYNTQQTNAPKKKSKKKKAKSPPPSPTSSLDPQLADGNSNGAIETQIEAPEEVSIYISRKLDFHRKMLEKSLLLKTNGMHYTRI